MVADELKGFELLWASGLFNRAAQGGELSFDFVSWQQMQACGEDRGFENGVFRSVEAEEVSEAADMDDSRADIGAVLRCIE